MGKSIVQKGFYIPMQNTSQNYCNSWKVDCLIYWCNDTKASHKIILDIK